MEYIPEILKERTIYISVTYATAAHKCCCGCGKEVVTPLSPTDWKLIFDGESVSLHPSIGNWSFACRSHYWITRNAVKWAEQWSDEDIRGPGERRVGEGEAFWSRTEPCCSIGSAIRSAGASCC